MKYILIFTLLILFQNCSKPKTVFICGDHICINKNEAQKYFEENLSIEVKIINKKKREKIDLVELNLKNNSYKTKQIDIIPKNKTKQNIKTLSKSEINKIKKDIKISKKEKKLAQKTLINKKKLIKKENNAQADVIKTNVYKKRQDIVDVCTIIKKCSIDEISKYLIKVGKDKSFPDITLRQ